jgi:phosphoribosylformylglycinamidine (FGAM) synthase PurS component
MSTAATTVQLNRALYMQQAVRDAAETFADFARFAITRKGEYYEVAISEIDADVDGDVVAEFCNHALANTMARKRKKV